MNQLKWCKDCRSLSEQYTYGFGTVRCRRARGEVGRSSCYGELRDLNGDRLLVGGILGAYEIGGWAAAIAVWDAAGRPPL